MEWIRNNYNPHDGDTVLNKEKKDNKILQISVMEDSTYSVVKMEEWNGIMN